MTVDSRTIESIPILVMGRDRHGSDLPVAINGGGRLDQVPHDFYHDVVEGEVPGHSLVHKFGRNASIDAATRETVWSHGGVYVWQTTADKITVVSDDANDTFGGTGAWNVEIFGLDVDYNEISELLFLNGTSPVTSDASFLRSNRGIVRAAGLDGVSGVNAGTLEFVDSGTGAIHLGAVEPGTNQSQNAFYTVPAERSAYIVSVTGSATRGSAASVDIDLKVRPFGEVFQLKGTFGAGSQSPEGTRPILGGIAVGAKSDIIFDAGTTANNMQVSVEFTMLIAHHAA